MTTHQLKRGSPGKTYGIHWGLSVAHTWTKALQIGRETSLTDLEILQIVKSEFPLRRKFERVSQIRSYFNRGVQGYGYGERLAYNDPRLSVPFDDEGYVIDEPRGRPRKGQEKRRHLFQSQFSDSGSEIIRLI